MNTIIGNTTNYPEPKNQKYTVNQKLIIPIIHMNSQNSY